MWRGHALSSVHWLQQDGATSTITARLSLVEWLSYHLEGRLNLHLMSDVNWPARSPDQTHLYFFLWGSLKSHTPIWTCAREFGGYQEQHQDGRSRRSDGHVCSRASPHRACVRLERNRGYIEHVLYMTLQ